MHQSHPRVIGIVIGIILQVPGQSVDQRAVIITVPRMHDQSGRFIHHHQILILVHNVERNILGHHLIFVTRTVHHDRDYVQRLHLVATLHRLTVYHDESRLSCLLNAVARSIDNAVEQILVNPYERLPFVGHHPEMFVKLSLVANGFYLINIVIFYLF
ncbi:hypothetical protein SDC9_139968 [bioreactor metagenome]|uniref:Uncharacterized protein n=1 Tax=bioreactor metagenome TaxID=1076179 RepID=A0A645DWX0_9ZZZZ